MSRSRVREKLYRDPVHDLIELDANSSEDRVLMALIDTPEFQRLRRIRQLGLAFTAFQGAEHSRFVHSIGTMWLASRILDRFERAYGVIREHVFPARCAALLHDLGHGPFSHVLEGLFDRDHEAWTREIVLSATSEVNHVLCGYDLALPSAVVAVMDHDYDPPFACDLISSQLDADRFDYLIRDSLMTGVKHGVFDLERLIATLGLDADRRRVVVSEKAIYPVEKYLQSRYHMFRQVYQHKTVKAAEAMLTALLRRAMALASDGERLAHPVDGAFDRFLRRGGKVSLDDFLSLDDSALQYHWTLWQDHSDPTLSDLARRLLRRDILKSIEVDPEADGFDEKLAAVRDLLERHGYDPDYYALLLESGDIPYRPYEEGVSLRQDQILVEDSSGEVRDIRDVSLIAAALGQGSYRQTRLAFPAYKGSVDIRAEVGRIVAQ